ncbi:MAG: MobF family relaxase [Pirellulaceae bacterium]
MLSIRKRKGGSLRYFLDQCKYYRERRHRSALAHARDPGEIEATGGLIDITRDASIPGEPEGTWVGGLAVELGLAAFVEDDQYLALKMGVAPGTNQPLTNNSEHPGRVSSFEFCFSAPKSVSVAWCRGDDALRDAIDRAQLTAAKEAFGFWEEQFAYSRTGKAGTGAPVKARVAAAVWQHHTNREDEPQLHTHIEIMNVAACRDGKTRTIDGRYIYGTSGNAVKFLVGNYYLAQLANHLRGLGFSIERTRHAFEIAGIPNSIMETFSTRRSQIEAELVRKKASGGRAAEVAALDTRKAKSHVARPITEHLANWQSICDEQRFTANALAAIRTKSTNAAPTNAITQTIEDVIEDLVVEQHHFTLFEFLCEIFHESVRYGTDADQLLMVAEEFLKNSPEIIRVPSTDSMPRFSTRSLLQLEHDLHSAIERLRNLQGPTAKLSDIHNAISAIERRTGLRLNGEQLDAVKHLAAGAGRIRFIHGAAGTGKTACVVLPAVQCVQALGYTVLGVAPTGEAKEKLREETGLDTYTVTRFLGDWTTANGSRPDPVPITKDRTVIVVDEASMIGIGQWKKLVDYAERMGATILAVGDYNQLNPVCDVAVYRSLCLRHGHRRLVRIARQKLQWQQRASRLFHDGRVGEALHLYGLKGHVHPMEHVDDALTAAVDRWQELGGHAHPDRVFLTAHSNAHVAELNRQAQTIRQRNGQLVGEPVAICNQSTGLPQCHQAYVGDMILFTKRTVEYGARTHSNSSSLATINNGTRARIVEIRKSSQGPLVRAQTADGKMTGYIPVEKFHAIDLGYAATNHKAQGKTVDHVIVIAAGSMQDRASTYVQATRARYSTDFFTTKELVPSVDNIANSPLASKISQPPEQRLASDFFHTLHTIVEPDRGRRIDQAISDLLHRAGDNLQDSAVIVASDNEARMVNHRIQQVRLHQLSQPSAKAPPDRFTSFDGTIYLLGDRVRVTRIPPFCDVTIGSRGTVVALDPKTEEIWVHVDSLDNVVKLKHGIGDRAPCVHDYALTGPQAKGCSFINVFEIPPEPLIRPKMSVAGTDYSEGDELRFVADHPESPLVAGTRATIQQIVVSERTLQLKLDNGTLHHLRLGENQSLEIARLTDDWRSVVQSTPSLSSDEVNAHLTDRGQTAYSRHLTRCELEQLKKDVKPYPAPPIDPPTFIRTQSGDSHGDAYTPSYSTPNLHIDENSIASSTTPQKPKRKRSIKDTQPDPDPATAGAAIKAAKAIPAAITVDGTVLTPDNAVIFKKSVIIETVNLTKTIIKKGTVAFWEIAESANDLINLVICPPRPHKYFVPKKPPSPFAFLRPRRKLQPHEFEKYLRPATKQEWELWMLPIRRKQRNKQLKKQRKEQRREARRRLKEEARRQRRERKEARRHEQLVAVQQQNLREELRLKSEQQALQEAKDQREAARRALEEERRQEAERERLRLTALREQQQRDEALRQQAEEQRREHAHQLAEKKRQEDEERKRQEQIQEAIAFCDQIDKEEREYRERQRRRDEERLQRERAAAKRKQKDEEERRRREARRRLQLQEEMESRAAERLRTKSRRENEIAQHPIKRRKARCFQSGDLVSMVNGDPHWTQWGRVFLPCDRAFDSYVMVIWANRFSTVDPDRLRYMGPMFTNLDDLKEFVANNPPSKAEHSVELKWAVGSPHDAYRHLLDWSVDPNEEEVGRLFDIELAEWNRLEQQMAEIRWASYNRHSPTATPPPTPVHTSVRQSIPVFSTTALRPMEIDLSISASISSMPQFHSQNTFTYVPPSNIPPASAQQAHRNAQNIVAPFPFQEVPALAASSCSKSTCTCATSWYTLQRCK